jgi:ubiquinone/menaquinone biosynthesis C-methylase UbiE
MLAASVRRLIHPPARLLRPYLSEGMTVMDIGCGMGFFSVPMAKMIGARGRMIAIDIQSRMLSGMAQYASKEAVADRIEPHLCGADSLRTEKWNGAVDFILLFMMLHEVTYQERMIREFYDALKPGGRLLLAEPIVHVGKKTYDSELAKMKNAGFRPLAAPKVPICRAALLEKAVSMQTKGQGGLLQ